MARTVLDLLGVNLDGAEYGHPTAADPGRINYNYVFPTASELTYYASKGLDVIRLPFSWERMQAAPGSALNGTYLAQMDATIAAANQHGLKVVLDLHNFGYGWNKLVGGADLPGSALADLWSKLATHYAGADVLFGLMNEPHDQTAQNWASVAAQSVAAIRAAGATQEILVSGTAWDSGQTWITSGNAAALSSAIHDPLHNTAYEIHQYLDSDSSGTSTDVVSPTIGADRLRDVTSWAEQTGNRLFLGEFGAGSDAASLTAMNNMLSFMNQHAAVWQGATYWAGGQWWGDYPFSIEPAGGTDKPQMGILTQYEAHDTGKGLPSHASLSEKAVTGPPPAAFGHLLGRGQHPLHGAELSAAHTGPLLRGAAAPTIRSLSGAPGTTLASRAFPALQAAGLEALGHVLADGGHDARPLLPHRPGG